MDPSTKLILMNILLVESNEFVRNSLSLAFKHKGCNILSVDSTKKAVKLLKKERFDLIISDYGVATCDGLNLFKLINIFSPKSLKVLISTDVNKDLIAESELIGIHKVIEKPFSFDHLIETLSALVDKR